MKWISVEDKKPNHIEYVLTIDKHGNIDVGFCSNGNWFCYGSDRPETIIYWMPLPPEPPKTKES